MDKLLKTVVDVIDAKQGNNIQCLSFENASPFYDYFVIADVSNQRQLSALADYVVEAVLNAGFAVHHIEKTADTNWILIDCNEVVVHLFLREQREIVKLEKLWRDHIMNYAG